MVISYFKNRDNTATRAYNNGPWDQVQFSIKLETKHDIHQKLANFMQEKDIYVNRLQSVIFGK